MEFQVTRITHRTEHGVIEADSAKQAEDMLRAYLWGDCVRPIRDQETINYKINGTHIPGRRTEHIQNGE